MYSENDIALCKMIGWNRKWYTGVPSDVFSPVYNFGILFLFLQVNYLLAKVCAQRAATVYRHVTEKFEQKISHNSN